MSQETQTSPKKTYNGPWYRQLGTRLGRTSRYLWLKFLRIEASPHNIAIGLAAGVFIGLLPVLPFQTVLAVALAFIVRGNKLAAALGTWVSNPLNWVPFYILFYYVGSLAVPFEVPPLDLQQVEMMQLIEAGWQLFAVMMLGGLIIATPSSVLSYLIAYKIIVVYRKRKAARKTQKLELAKAELVGDLADNANEGFDQKVTKDL